MVATGTYVAALCSGIALVTLGLLVPAILCVFVCLGLLLRASLLDRRSKLC